MSPDQFNKAWEKLGKAPVKAEVLKLVLSGHTNADIARLRERPEGTIRKQISTIYKDFGIESKFPGDSTQRDQLKNLFQMHKPDWITPNHSTSTNQISKEGQQEENETNKPLLVLPRTEDEDLMSLAIRLLDKLGFDQKFKLIQGFGYTGYRLKNPSKYAYPYLLILSQKQEGLCISMPQHILGSYILTLKYWMTYCATEEERIPDESLAGRFLVLPSKKDIFLDSLHPNYWNILEVERKTIGTYSLNEIVKSYSEVDGEVYFCGSDSISLNEFNPNTLSDSNSYLILEEDQRFSYTWKICFQSSEVLQEVIEHFGKIIILD